VTLFRAAGQPVPGEAFHAAPAREIIPAMIRLFVDRLTVIDFSYLHPQRGLLGESWLCDIELSGEPDAQGMILDFGEGLQIVHVGPPASTCLVDAAEITPQTLARAIATALLPELPGNVAAIEVTLREEPHGGACYQYSHGLRQHDGNCQRIAHGHRSRIEIWRDGVRDAALERAWAERWRDVYIGTRANLIGTPSLGGVAYCRFGYRGTQGAFALELPADRCRLIDTDSTVENLARHVAERLAIEQPGARYRVRAFEGVDKGAVAET